jgi:hypothetical protein
MDPEDEDYDEDFDDFGDDDDVEEAAEPMKWDDGYAPCGRKLVTIVVPNHPSAFDVLGRLERKKLGFP